MEAIAAGAAQTAATSALGSAASSAAEKGVNAAKGEEQTKSVKMGINASQIILSSVMTAIAIEVFSKVSKNFKGSTYYAASILISVVAAIFAAFLRVMF